MFSRRKTVSPAGLRPRNARLVSDVKNSETLSSSGCSLTMFDSMVEPHRPVPTMKTGGVMSHAANTLARTSGGQAAERNIQCPGGIGQSVIVCCEFNGLSMPAQVVRRRQVQRVEGANGCGKRFERADEDRR